MSLLKSQGSVIIDTLVHVSDSDRDKFFESFEGNEHVKEADAQLEEMDNEIEFQVNLRAEVTELEEAAKSQLESKKALNVYNDFF